MTRSVLSVVNLYNQVKYFVIAIYMAADNRLMTVYYVLLGLALILFFSLLNNSRDRDRRSREAQRRDDAQHEDVNIFLNNLGGIIDEWDKEK